MNSSPTCELPGSGSPELLFVLLPDGGLAPNGTDALDPLARALREQYPQAALLRLQAPLRDADGRCVWWQGETSAEGVDTAAKALVAQVREATTGLGLDWPQAALAGVGDGAMLALEAAQFEARFVGRVLAFAGGYLARPEHAPEKVCIHLMHGMADARWPYRHVVDAAQTLVSLGADVTADVLPLIDHGLHPDLIDKAMTQLRTFIPARLWREAVVAAQENERPVDL